MDAFRIVIFSSVPTHRLRHFLRRLKTDLPGVTVAGVLYETERPPMPGGKRLQRIKSLATDPVFLRYAAAKAYSGLSERPNRLLERALRAAHADSDMANGPAPTIESTRAECESDGIRFMTTQDFHAAQSLEFVRSLNADLGIIYGTRILKPKLFSIPARGSINIHKHKVPEYRGGGAPGLWEMRDGRTEQGITVHRVLKQVDAGAVLGTRAFPIDPLDTLTSVGLKADLVSIDCLIEVIGAESRNEAVETPQPADGTVYKGFQPHQIWAIERQIAKTHPPYRPKKGRPLVKLLPRMLAYPALRRANRQRAVSGQFPVTILFHHVITDKPKYMGLPTEAFLQHIRYLKKHYRIASLPEALAMLESGHVPEPTVVLTFDDGYAENFLCLRAVVEAEDIPVTLFVCTEHIEKQMPFAHDLGRKEEGFLPLTWDQIRYLDAHGVTIAAHTRNHWDCGQGDERKLEYEINGSLEDLRRELGHDVPYFSFPKGFPKNMSEEALCIAHARFPYVFAAAGGRNTPPLSPRTLIRRASHPESLLELELLLQGVLDFER